MRTTLCIAFLVGIASACTHTPAAFQAVSASEEPCPVFLDASTWCFIVEVKNVGSIAGQATCSMDVYRKGKPEPVASGEGVITREVGPDQTGQVGLTIGWRPPASNARNSYTRPRPNCLPGVPTD